MGMLVKAALAARGQRGSQQVDHHQRHGGAQQRWLLAADEDRNVYKDLPSTRS
ncbi:hypothetical protein ACWED2_10130 [Amycolatopsis sp. NPDC005003]